NAIDARVARGSFGTWEGRARGGVTRGALAASANVGYQGSRGDFRFFDDNGTPFNTADDSTTTRINNRFDAAHAPGALTWSPGGLGRGRWQSETRIAGESGAVELAWPTLPLGLAARGAADERADRARPTNSADAYADPPLSHRRDLGATLALELNAPHGRATL